MLIKNKKDFGQGEIIFMDDLVPDNHLLRKIDSAVDFTRIYDFTENLYCADNGRPSIDPVVLFKMVLIQHLYGIPSLRRTAAEVEVNAAYRWFLGYTFSEKTPHFATLSYNFKNRFTEETIEEVFNWILYEIEHAGYLSPEAVFIDGTHIKANANIKKKVKRNVSQGRAQKMLCLRSSHRLRQKRICPRCCGDSGQYSRQRCVRRIVR